MDGNGQVRTLATLIPRKGPHYSLQKWLDEPHCRAVLVGNRLLCGPACSLNAIPIEGQVIFR